MTAAAPPSGLDNSLLVIFGASGDLTSRMLLPALLELEGQRLLPPDFTILGTGRTPLDDDGFRERAGPAGRGLSRLHYVAFDPTRPEAYGSLARRIADLTPKRDRPPNILFYLAVPPDLQEPILQGLEAAALNRSGPSHWRRLVVEKPFGRDLESARRLNRILRRAFPDHAVFRIDHYLGKEAVQNILVFRFGNGIFEPLWNRNYIDRIEITSAEELGVGSRGGYYDRAGALRDMVQNHLLQVLAFIAMEPPAASDAHAVRHETLKVFQSLRPIRPEAVAGLTVRGQYTAATIRGARVPGYREEPDVDPESRTETYAALRSHLDNWRWSGVPFCLRTGKRLPARVTEVVIRFKPAPLPLFREATGDAGPNQLVVRIQPDEGLVLTFNLKVPGAGFRAKRAGLEFHYKDLGHARLPSAYARLLLDALQGDATLFQRDDESEASWAYIDPILKAWEAEPAAKLYGYPAGTWGPEAADALIGVPGESWRFPCHSLSADGAFCEL